MAAERKEKIIRVLQILQSTDEKTPINALKIVDKLENEYIIGKTDRRSIYRDIRLLQYCGYKIEQAKDKKQGWYMNKHVFDDWEIKVMMDAVQQARCVSEDEAKNIKEKLLSLTSKRGKSRFSHMIMPQACNVKVDIKIGMYIETMLEAIYMHRKIRFQYTEINEKMEKVLRREGKIYSLNLYTIYWSENNYYLIGSHDNHDGLTSYRLDRVENLYMSDEHSIDAREKLGDNPELYIQNYIEKSVNHFSGESTKIEVEYKPSQATNAILYDFTGGNVIMHKLANGMCRASFFKMNSVTLIGWFMQYADKFKIIRPAELRDKVKDQLIEALESYND